MNLKDKLLYQQIHLVKLMVDFSPGFYSTYLMWLHQLWGFALLFLLPSLITTFMLVRFAELVRLIKTHFGHYVATYMTKKIELLLFSGHVIMWAAAWYHLPVLIGIGFLIILSGWAADIFINMLADLQPEYL